MEQPRSEDSFCFANSFWATADKKRPLEGNLVGIEIAKDGYDTLMNRMKAGTRTIEELRGVYRERSALEEEYSKKLYKLAKNPVGSSEVGHMERAIGQMKTELETMGKAHADLAALLKSQDNQLGEFVSRRDGGRKLQQTSVEKAWKNKCSQEAYVSKAKQKYESDAMTINTMHAQAALIQGRDLDKLQAKLDKTVQTVGTAEKEYSQFVKVLKETTAAWNEQWRVYCNTCQDQEEERLDFLKSRLWDWANALSTVAMNEDESAERTRTALEQCDPRTDLKIFVTDFGTGRDIPDAPVYVDFGRQQTATARQTYKTANFSRSSARGGNIRHSPSGIDEIQRAFQSVPVATAVVESRSRSRSPEKSQQPGGAIGTSVAANSMEPMRPFSGSTSQSSFTAAPKSPPKADPNSLSSRGSTTFNNAESRQEGSNISTSRFVVSPSANPSARSSGDRAPVLPPKQGVAPASLFQRGQPPASEPELSTRQQEPRRPSVAAVPEPSASIEDEDDDPITRAFNQLNADISPPRAHRPSTGAVALPGMTNTTPRQSQTQPAGMNSRQSQPNLNKSKSTEFKNSRSTSPSPALMQPPHHDEVPAVVSQYGQAFPGERNGERHAARPHSRQGSNTSNHYSNTPTNLQSPNGTDSYGRSTSPTPVPFAGVGARGRSPSPQPFQQPPANRAPSPQPTTNYQSDRRPSFDHRYSNQQQQQQSQPLPHAQHIASPSNEGQRRGSTTAYRPPSPAYDDQRRGSSSTYRPPAQGIPPSTSQIYAQSPQNYGPPTTKQTYQPPPQTYQAAQQQYSAPSHQQQQQPARQPSPSPAQYRQPSPSQAYQQPQQPVSTYQHQQQQQQQQQQPVYAPPPQQQQHQQPPSMMRGVSANSAYGGVYSSPQQPVAPVSYAQSPASSYAPSRSPSTASSITPVGPPPPTGQQTEDGRPILFYVNAIYSYNAAGPDEFSFSEGDVIAVTATDPDGWWHGTPVGLSVPGQIFPSNFTEILP